MSTEVGFGRGDITVFHPRMSMLGWGLPDQFPLAVGAPLKARAMVLRTAGRDFAYVCADLCFISSALRARVLEMLEARGRPWLRSDLMLTATHTHSGPNGFHHALFYDLSAPGFSTELRDALAAGMTDAIEMALARLEPARLRWGESTIAVRDRIATNRSIEAARRNPEVPRDRSAHAAIDQRMTVIRADSSNGLPLGALTFFPLHGTCVHGDRRLLHPDHKGLAAEAFEALVGAPDFVAVFAQGAAGDVSPNVRFDRVRRVMRGLESDDLAHAARVARVQAQAARRAWTDATREIESPFLSTFVRADFEHRPVPGRFGASAGRTTSARLGLAMAGGTAEGPGPLRQMLRWLPAPDASAGDPKRVLLEVGGGVPRRLGGWVDPAALPLPPPAFRRVRALRRAGGATELPWIPTVLPVQLWRWGPLAIAALPNEPTFIAGHRLERLLRESLGVERTVINGYANGYAGYLTTREEYALQRYEGAYTLFGPDTWAAFADVLDGLATRLPALDGVDAGPETSRCTPAQERVRALTNPRWIGDLARG